MNKGWFFGCSFTYGAGCVPGCDYYDNYYEPGDLRWPSIVSEALNVSENNLGQNSASNMFILNRFVSTIKFFNPGDKVVVGLTDPTRVGFFHYNSDLSVKQMSVNAFDQTYPDGRFSNFMSEPEFKAVQRFGIYVQGPNEDKWRHYYRRIFRGYFRLLNQLGVETYLWEFDQWTKHEAITHATKEKVQDRHWSFGGHRTFAEQVINNFKGEKRAI